jgi:hypothetical protein
MTLVFPTDDPFLNFENHMTDQISGLLNNQLERDRWGIYVERSQYSGIVGTTWDKRTEFEPFFRLKVNDPRLLLQKYKDVSDDMAASQYDDTAFDLTADFYED